LLLNAHCYKAPVRRLSRVIAICLLSTTAHADNAEFHATAAGSVATTDNVNGSANDPRGSVFSDVRPGVLFTYNARRVIQALTAQVDMFYYFGAAKPNVTFSVDYKAFLLTGPRSELSLGASASKGQINALSAATYSNENPLLVQPEGRVDTINASASEDGSWAATEFTRLAQRGFVRTTTTEDTDPDVAVTTKSFDVGGGIGVDHRMRRDDVDARGRRLVRPPREARPVPAPDG
jgi:hypothetical protein